MNANKILSAGLAANPHRQFPGLSVEPTEGVAKGANSGTPVPSRWGSGGMGHPGRNRHRFAPRLPRHRVERALREQAIKVLDAIHFLARPSATRVPTPGPCL